MRWAGPVARRWVEHGGASLLQGQAWVRADCGLGMGHVRPTGFGDKAGERQEEVFRAGHVSQGWPSLSP